MGINPEIKQSATLYLICGKMAAGKSTLAKQLSLKHNLLLFSEDDLLSALYPGEITDVPGYVKRSSRLKTALEKILVHLLEQGNSLVMDFPANTAAQRAWLVGLAKSANAKHQLYFIDLPDSTCKSQLLKRAAEHPQRAATDTIEMFDTITRYFETPHEKEGLNITLIESDGS